MLALIFATSGSYEIWTPFGWAFFVIGVILAIVDPLGIKAEAYRNRRR